MCFHTQPENEIGSQVMRSVVGKHVEMHFKTKLELLTMTGSTRTLGGFRSELLHSAVKHPGQESRLVGQAYTWCQTGGLTSA